METAQAKKSSVVLGETEKALLKKECYELGLGRVAEAGGLKSYQGIGQLLRKGWGRKTTVDAIYSGIKKVQELDAEERQLRLEKAQQLTGDCLQNA